MSTALQLALGDPTQFQPLVKGAGHYVVALQTKAGELRALREAPPSVWEGFTPLLEVLGPKSPGVEPFRRSRIEGWMKRLSAAVGSHTVFLDRLRLAPNHLAEFREGRVPVLTAIHGEARHRGVVFVPVLQLGDAASTVRQVADSAARDGRGVALRVPLLGTAAPDGQGFRALVSDAVEAVQVEFAGVDLLLDLGQIPEDAEVDAENLAAMIEDLISVGQWRNIIMLGTTMPRSLGGGIVEAGTIGRLTRKEWTLWRALRELKPSRLPTYGDYAVQHPDPPLDVASGQIPLGMRGAIRYTHQSVTVIPRAKAPRYEEGREQYRELCRLLVRQPEFAGCRYTWGDQQIAACADGTCEPGWEDHWRGVATSHHLRFVVDQLARLS